VYITYLYFRNRSLDEIRVDVYKLFLKAEHKFTGTKEGKEKLKWVVQRARSMLPGWLSIFITEELLTMIVDEWFAAVKDLLDDGKLNNSDEEE
jgi:hypothetical protein